MMRFLPLILTTALLSACAGSLEDMNRLNKIGLTSLTGQPVARLGEIYGKPASIVPLATGEVGYTWTTHSDEEIFDRNDYLPKDQRVERDRRSHADILVGNFRPYTIERYCKMDVIAHNGIVVKATADDSDSPMACAELYDRWTNYQLKHPELFKQPQ